MMKLFQDEKEKTPKYYLNLVKDWKDPYPKPVISRHDDIEVIRDDLLGVGSKVRGLDYIIGHDPNYAHIKEWVFGSCPAVGYAQISLPVLCKKYGKKAVLFMAERNMNNLHPYQKRGLELGAEYHWVPDGMLPVTQKRARDYVAEKPESRAVFPIGLEHETVLGSFIKIARTLPTPDEFWSVGSSGTLNRSLQLAWPEAKAFVVSVGHTMSEREIGRAHMIKSPYKFNQHVKKSELPPFPSSPWYDAKAWPVMMEWYKSHSKPDKVYFWNVGA